MNNKINIKMQNGNEVETEPICYIENEQSGKKYLYHTLNETLGTANNTTVKIYVSKINQNNPEKDVPITEGEWAVLKDYMAKTLKDTPIEGVKYLKLDEILNTVSCSDKVIAMPTSYDYINKQKGIYAQAIAKQSVITPPKVETPVITPNTIAPNDAIINTPNNIDKTAVTSNISENVTPVVNPIVEETQIKNASETQPIVEKPIVNNEQVITPNVNSTQNISMEMPPVEDNLGQNPILNINQQPLTPPIVEPPIAPETPVVPPINVEPQNVSETPVVAPINVQPKIEEKQEPINNDQISNNPKMDFINIEEISKKYDEMIKQINTLKSMEIEASQRYNDIIKLNTMHNEQHANYVLEQQRKEQNLQQQVTMDPPSVTPIVPEPVQKVSEPISQDNLETNWFDMPAA